MFLTLLDILRLRSGPQDLPAGWTFAIVFAVAYVAQGFVADQLMGEADGEARSLLAITVQFGIVSALLNADQAANLELLTMLDKGSRASVVLPFDNPDAAMSADGPEAEQNRTGEQIEFSLLGSRRTTQAVKDHCQAHIPIPFDN